MYGIPDYLQACQDRKKFLTDQLQWLKSERQKFSADAQRLEGVADRIRQEMVGYLIPELHDDHIAALEQRLSYPGLRPIKRDYDARFEAAEKRRLELEAMDEIQNHDYLIDQANRDVEDVQPAYDKMRAKIGAWEGSKWFSKLHKRGYFNRDYKPGFFRRLLDWRHVSLLMAQLAKKADLDFQVPDKLREHYRNLREETDTIFEAFNKRVAERDRIAGLKTEYDQILTAPERLLSDLFFALGKAITEHLDACPEDLRLQLARSDQNLNTFLRKETGVRKQIQYLRELSVTRIDANIDQVDQELGKINSKIEKLELQRRRGKRKRFSADELRRMRDVKADKWERRRAKTTRIRGKISDFDHYDRGSCVSDFLWWDLMTGAAAANDIFEVRDFRNRNPDWDYQRYHDPTSEEVGSVHDPANVFDDAAADLASTMSARGDDDVFSDVS